jgi:hypothetical protein
MGDESFDECIETVAGLDDYVTGGPRSSRIPVLTSRWTYENWLERREDTHSRSDPRKRACVPRVPG